MFTQAKLDDQNSKQGMHLTISKVYIRKRKSGAMSIRIETQIFTVVKDTAEFFNGLAFDSPLAMWANKHACPKIFTYIQTLDNELYPLVIQRTY